MRFVSFRSVVAAFALVLAAGAARAQNSPEYESWASHQPGTSVTLKSTVAVGGQTTDVTITYTLKKVEKDKVVVEVKSGMVMFGHEMPGIGKKLDIPAKGHAPTSQPDAKTEDVTVDGKTYSCTVTENTTPGKNGKKTTAKTWICPTVPNLLVKSQIVIEGDKKPKTTTLELVKVDIK